MMTQTTTNKQNKMTNKNKKPKNKPPKNNVDCIQELYFHNNYFLNIKEKLISNCILYINLNKFYHFPALAAILSLFI